MAPAATRPPPLTVAAFLQRLGRSKGGERGGRGRVLAMAGEHGIEARDVLASA